MSRCIQKNLSNDETHLRPLVLWGFTVFFFYFRFCSRRKKIGFSNFLYLKVRMYGPNENESYESYHRYWVDFWNSWTWATTFLFRWCRVTYNGDWWMKKRWTLIWIHRHLSIFYRFVRWPSTDQALVGSDFVRILFCWKWLVAIGRVVLFCRQTQVYIFSRVTV
jgi:hypothetical protein